MKHVAQILLVLGLASSSACAHAKTNPQRIVRVAKKALVGLDIALEELQPIVDEATKLRIDRCRNTKPGPERDACLGPFAVELEPKLSRAAALYDATVLSLDEIAKLWAELAPLIEAARQEVGQ